MCSSSLTVNPRQNTPVCGDGLLLHMGKHNTVFWSLCIGTDCPVYYSWRMVKYWDLGASAIFVLVKVDEAFDSVDRDVIWMLMHPSLWNTSSPADVRKLHLPSYP